jgi:hypothetical protein
MGNSTGEKIGEHVQDSESVHKHDGSPTDRDEAQLLALGKTQELTVHTPSSLSPWHRRKKTDRMGSS